MVPNRNFEVYLGSAWLGTIEADDEQHAAEVALRTFGAHLAGLLVVKKRGEMGRTQS